MEAGIAVDLQVCSRYGFRVCTLSTLIEGNTWTVFMFTEKRCGSCCVCAGAAKVFWHRMLKVQRSNPVTCSHIVIRGNCWNLCISDTYCYVSKKLLIHLSTFFHHQFYEFSIGIALTLPVRKQNLKKGCYLSGNFSVMVMVASISWQELNIDLV